MLQVAAEELFQRESHGAALAVMGVVLPAKGDLIAVHRKEAVIRDRHAMGVAGQILQDVLGSAKGPLRINNPFFPEERAQERCECLLVRERLTFPEEGKLIGMKCSLQPSDELPAKNTAEHPGRQEEVWR